MKTIILVALVAVAIASAAVIPEEEEEIVERRFLSDTFKKIKDGFNKLLNKAKHLGDQIKDAFSKKKINGVIKLLKKKGEDVVGSIKKVFKISKGKKLDDIVARLFQGKGKYIGHYLSEAGKEVGHFFVKEVKGGSFVSVFKDKKIADFIKHVYKKAKGLVKTALNNKQFDSVLHKLISLIDSPISEKACSTLAEKVIEQILGSGAGTAAGSVTSNVCKPALKFLEMTADRELKVVEEMVGNHH